ncbi:hypothetical protein [Xanthomarina spongicola]|uniref:Uncharacterized protein n=1 Tax=Xanthomarina spongicola TaxID=570520 RepID=A0A316DNH9_9FLAO|nr:hypothetical protein [Xanthomarina spongicola]PWK19737.1 hypothetical protein LX78_01087 [Xanthomarina spongicola]
MKIKLILVILLITNLSFGQKEKDKFRKYTVISIEGASETVYSKILPVDEIGIGIKLYDYNGKNIKRKVTPMLYDYIIFKDIDSSLVKLKSIKNDRKTMNFRYKKSFMEVLIDKPNGEKNNGKIGFYRHDYFVANGAGQAMEYNLYFEDDKGTYRVDRKKNFKTHSELLGEELFKKMKQSKKNKTEFLYDYFRNYNEEK